MASAAPKNTVAALANAIAQIPGFTAIGYPTGLAISNLGILLTGSMSMGFVIGFLRG